MDGVIKYLSNMTDDRKSARKQLILGSASGWCVGYIGIKVGKASAIIIGCGVILLQVANQNGYIKINWNVINTKVDQISSKVEETVTGIAPNFMDKAINCANYNTYLSTGFLGGLLIGIVCG